MLSIWFQILPIWIDSNISTILHKLLFFYIFRYSFAIVGINLTHMALKLLQDGSAKSHMFNVCALSPMEEERIPILKHFHHFYSYLFVEFDKFWLAEKPRDVMEFTRIRDLFENQIRTMLADRNCHFRINITVENVWFLTHNKTKELYTKSEFLYIVNKQLMTIAFFSYTNIKICP